MITSPSPYEADGCTIILEQSLNILIACSQPSPSRRFPPSRLFFAVLSL